MYNVFKFTGELENIVQNAIIQFDRDNLNNFDAVYRHSKMLRTIDDSNDSILSNTTNIRLRKNFNVDVNKELGYTVNFGNAFYNPHS